jgi:polygalacturonase
VEIAVFAWKIQQSITLVSKIPGEDFAMTEDRRQFLKIGLTGAASAATVGALNLPSAGAQSSAKSESEIPFFNVRRFGARGDGTTIDTPAINNAIAAAAETGGGTVTFPAGTYASYSIHLKSNVSLYLEPGATIRAASTPLQGTSTGGYDAAEPQGPWEPYQDYGHNHWHNSLIWGEDIHDVAILGPGLIWGKGLSRGHPDDTDLPKTDRPGVGNKAIALKNCRNVVLRDFSMLAAGWFAILVTGVDNLTIDNLKIDTNRDGMDIDCCRNVRVSNCSVNSPWDDAICPKSSFALGYPRATENVTISNCYVTGGYQLGTLLDGTFKRLGDDFKHPIGRVKCGTESNGGFKNIAISNCVFESCRGFALETVDGAICEDITFTGITMRDVRNSPLFLRLGTRMRGPKDTRVGSLKRVLISNVVSSGALPDLCSIVSGVPGHRIEDIKVSDVYLHQLGGGSRAMAELQPPEKESEYPEPSMFGALPASGFFLRHIRNIEMSNIEIAAEQPDARPGFWLHDVEGGDFFRVTAPRTSRAFLLRDMREFRVFGSRKIKDTTLEQAAHQEL